MKRRKMCLGKEIFAAIVIFCLVINLGIMRLLQTVNLRLPSGLKAKFFTY